MVKVTGNFTVGKYVTRWRNAVVSDEEPGFPAWQYPPPSRTMIAIDKSVIVFGFLEWQDETGAWRSDWPYSPGQLKATLSLAGPTPKSKLVDVGTGKGECWTNFGAVSAGSYMFTLDFAGNDKFHDGIVQQALQVGEAVGVLEVFLASLPLVTVLAVVGVQELNKMGVLGR